jgi:cytochrome c oxidase assembly factor CtaG
VALAAAAAVLLVTALVPPLSSDARHVEALEALQFALLALGVPALVVLAAPWRMVGLRARLRTTADATGKALLERPSAVDRVAATRRRHLEPARSVAYLILETAVVVAWRLPASVDALARHGWLSLVEAVTLVGPGIGLWLELVGSAPFTPRLGRPKRIAVAAVAMWTIWVTAYLVGLSHASVYRAYAHVPGVDLSVQADQAIATGVLWFTSLCAFVPVIFSNLMIWLRSDEDPDEALHRLVRDERRGTTQAPAGGAPMGVVLPGEGSGASEGL